MQNFLQKTVLITGSSSGIGRACAEAFAEQGARLILTARRIDRLKELAKQLEARFHTHCLPLHLDVRRSHEVEQVLASLTTPWDQIDILVNNAGLALASNKFYEGDLAQWDTMIATNISGLLYVTRKILPGMLARQSGHIINIGSVAGHDAYPNGNVYCATKHAVRAISKSLRLDLLGTPLRVTEIDPGAVETEFSEVRWNDKDRAREFYKDFQPLNAHDIADAVIYCASRPAHVNISELCVYPVDQASVNHIHRR